MSSESDLEAFFGFNPNTYAPPSGLRLGEEAKRSLETVASKAPSLVHSKVATGGVHTTTVNIVKENLQAAVTLELSTIPLYLYAAYSIKSGSAKYDIIRVVKEEMLHLALAGNILCAIGGSPLVYWKTTAGHVYVPEFPATMLYQKIQLNMMRANKSSIRTFMELESPDNVAPVNDVLSGALDHYKSIGDFYHAIDLALQFLNRLIPPPGLFKSDTFSRQYTAGDGSWWDDGMTNIVSIDTANAAIKTIVVQGEGSSTLTSSPAPPSAPPAAKSHYEVFKALFDGPELDCYAVLQDPKTKDYNKSDTPTNKGIYKVLLACDAAYCYLLITVERMWDPSFPSNKRSDLISNNLQSIMSSVISPMATYLAKQPVPKKNPNDPNEEQKYFLPFFNFYQFQEPGGSADRAVAYHNELSQLFVDAVGYAPELKSVLDTVNGLIPVAGYFNPNWKS